MRIARLGPLCLCLLPACDDGAGMVRDAALADAAGGFDASAEDSAPADASAFDLPLAEAAPAPPDAPLPYARPAYQRLSETGLFAGAAHSQLNDGVRPFHPAHALWSDGADKLRWISLPPGTRIDTSDMDHWQFPVGTKLWKQFSRGGVPLETRLIERYGDGRDDFWMGAFVWNADGSDAVFAESGARDVNGTTHDVPEAKLCWSCHGGEPGRVLGFSAIQLSHDDGPTTLARLAREDRLTVTPAGTFPVPGTQDAPVAARALGYLHANCAHCHSPTAIAWRETQMVLRLSVKDTGTVPQETALWKSIVGGALQEWKHDGYSQRVAPGHPETSAIMFRINARGTRDQMPPLATELIDDAGIGALTTWIKELSP